MTRRLASFLVAVLVLTKSASASPVDLSAPQNTLGAADMFGHFRTWREIADVDLGQGLTLPLRAGFNLSLIHI